MNQNVEPVEPLLESIGDTTLIELINQNNFSPEGRILKVTKAIHVKHKHNPFKTLTELIQKKLRKITN
jgi:hypothetical protein